MFLISAYDSGENAAVLYGEHRLRASQTLSMTRLFIHFLLLFESNVKQWKKVCNVLNENIQAVQVKLVTIKM